MDRGDWSATLIARDRLRRPTIYLAAVAATLWIASPAQANEWSKPLDERLRSDSLSSRLDAAELLEAQGYTRLTESLITAALQEKQPNLTAKDLRRVLRVTSDLLKEQGSEFLRSALVATVEQSKLERSERPVMLWALARTKFLQNSAASRQEVIRLIQELEGTEADPEWLALGYQMRGAVYAVSGALGSSLADYTKCRQIALGLDGATWEELAFRCTASIARVLYEQKQYVEAERAWDLIPKRSFMWTEVLIEQAWSAFSRGDYNRSLGKLAAYASPHLRFTGRGDVGMLRGLSLLALCRYSEIQSVLVESEKNTAPLQSAVERLQARHGDDADAYFESARRALRSALHTADPTHRVLNRLARTPTFQAAVEAEERRLAEWKRIRRPGNKLSAPALASIKKSVDSSSTANRQIAGGFIASGLADLRDEYLHDAEQVSFIRLEMLKHVREQLMAQIQGRSLPERSVGKVKPQVRDDQYFFEFNSEYWNDELGDYVFGLESKCRGDLS